MEFKPGQRVKVIKTGLIGTVRLIKSCGRVVVKLKIPEGTIVQTYNPEELIIWTQGT